MDFDPHQVSYSELLEVFWASHNPHSPGYSTQYQAVVFAHDEQQASLARASAERIESTSGRTVLTQISPVKRFHVAEDYHQKYGLRREKLMMRELRRFGYDEAGVRDSTAAARLNGYLYGVGSGLQLENEVDSLGLSSDAREHLLATVVGRR